MVYAYDRNIQMPTKDLYDTQIMAMALNVAKDEYNKAEKRLDDLTQLYSDFYSPSDVDMASWQREVVDPIKGKIDELYARGIDPLRSAEGHALLAKVSRNLPYDDINKLKQSSKVLQKNLENAAELQAKGLYDPEYVKFLDRDPKTWDTLNRGVFQWASPSPAYSMETLISPMYKDRQARPLTQEEVIGEIGVYDPMKNYTGYLQSDIMENAKKNLPAFLNTPDGQYQKYLATQQVAKEQGIDPRLVSDTDANERLLENMAGAANRFYIGPDGDVDKIKLEDYKAQKNIAAYKEKYDYAHRNDDGNNPFEQSYARDMYMSAVGQIFGTDMYTASHMVADGSAGNDLFKTEQSLLKRLNYDVDRCIAAHTSRGNSESNAVLLDIPMGGKSGSSSSAKTLNSKTQFSKASLGGKKIYDASEIVFNTAGYRLSQKNRTKDAEKNLKNLPKASYFTVTEDNVGYLDKGGQFRTLVKVIGDNGTIGYIRAHVDSNKKHGGQAYSSAVKTRNQDLGYDAKQIGSIKQRDLKATKTYTKSGSANNDGAVEPDMDEPIE